MNDGLPLNSTFDNIKSRQHNIKCNLSQRLHRSKCNRTWTLAHLWTAIKAAYILHRWQRLTHWTRQEKSMRLSTLMIHYTWTSRPTRIYIISDRKWCWRMPHHLNLTKQLADTSPIFIEANQSAYILKGGSQLTIYTDSYDPDKDFCAIACVRFIWSNIGRMQWEHTFALQVHLWIHPATFTTQADNEKHSWFCIHLWSAWNFCCESMHGIYQSDIIMPQLQLLTTAGKLNIWCWQYRWRQTDNHSQRPGWDESSVR